MASANKKIAEGLEYLAKGDKWYVSSCTNEQSLHLVLNYLTDDTNYRA